MGTNSQRTYAPLAHFTALRSTAIAWLRYGDDTETIRAGALTLAMASLARLTPLPRMFVQPPRLTGLTGQNKALT